jgi:CheY-like chemotaxis protein
MPAKILLADKSITIQKVVEMLFSGRDYEVVCVSDGETALSEAARVLPDVVLADVDLPRVDGYGVAIRLKQTPQLAQTPVILMMSRDDVYDSAKGKQAGIVDNIAKPFESQELIGKVKKALAAAPPRPEQPVAAERPAAAPPKPPSPFVRTAPASPPPASAPAAVGAKQATPTDIFDIIQEAPTESDIKKAAVPAPAAEEESVYEVEPEVEEVEEPHARDIAKALPVGAKAVEEIRAGLGLSGKGGEEQAEIIPFESFDLAMESETKAKEPILPKPRAAQPAAPSAAGPPQSTLPESELRRMAEEAVTKMAREAFEKVPMPKPPTIPADELRSMAEQAIASMAKEAFASMPAPQVPAISASELWSIAEETISKMAKEMFAQMPPVQAPQVSDDAVRGMVEEKVSKIANEAFGKITTSKTPTLPESELRDIAEKTIAKMAEDVMKNMPAPPLPKISDETVRRGLEVVLAKIARDVAKEVFEQVAWEVIPPLAEHLIKEEIERLKAME